ncbi:MAG: hypothetical protein DRJ97_06490 [Thermoprotei archaeon]|nr:MAG: hypothetical protein DRJ97_06490 [Thermoprotei archaeon]
MGEDGVAVGGRRLKVRFVDTTLCEGELAGGVAFTVDQKLEVARELDKVGVDVVEVARPTVSDEDFEAVREVASEGLRAEVAARAWLFDDLEAAVDSGADRLIVALPASREAASKLGLTWSSILGEAKRAVKLVKERGLKVTVLAEWATQTPLGDLKELVEALRGEGVDDVCLADVASVADPSLFKEFVKGLGGGVEVKCYNGLGLAVANVLAAVEAGASGVHVSVNGLGEGPGIASMAEVAAALRRLRGVETVKLDLLPRLSAIVEKYSGVPLPVHSPLVGEHSFTVKLGPHVDAALSGLNALWPLPPSEVGRRVEVEASKHSSIRAVREKLSRLGVALSEEQALEVLKALRSKASARLRDSDLLDLVEATLGRREVRVPRRVEAVVMVQCASNVHTSSVARRIKGVNGVEEVFEVSGEYDVEVRLTADSIAELNERLDRIRAVRGVVGTRTRFILKRY